jgi:DNA helicase II / ATP-dependent DNA helicase PcrA
MADERKINEEKFISEYNKLNPAQKAAVDKIDGPVMVVAGPGTGKTQLLALRVCNILRLTDMYPQNVLCLTFTDAGANAMRNRLVRFMGPDAYLVGIYTYHSFCNKIIRENNEYFGQFKELSNADEIERIECIMEVLESLPLDYPIKRNVGDTTYDKDAIEYVFKTMKKEGWSAEYIAQKAAEDEAYLRQDPSMKYTTSRAGHYQKGDIKIKEVQKHMDKLKMAIHGSKLIDQYNNALHKRFRIDFEDTINLVLDQLKTNDDIKLRYQEQFQYVLADEYQDTNGAQNEVLFQLCDYDDQPNIFVVGDDDQSIYRFQGASMFNITNFKSKYNPQSFVLDINYRSHQHILDSAMKLIEFNKERLCNDDPSLNKNLTQGLELDESKNHHPIVLKYSNALAQEVGLIEAIEKLHAEGTPYKDIAVLYRGHKEVINLVKFLSSKGIPLKVKKKVNVLIQSDVLKILNLMTYAVNENKYMDSQRDKLFEILHYDCFKLNPADVGKLCVYCSRRQDDDYKFESWRGLMADESKMTEIGITNPSSFKKIHDILEELIQNVSNHTPQVIYEKTLSNTGMLSEILNSGDVSWRLQVVNKLFDYIKDETAKNGDLKIQGILSMLEQRKEFEIDLPVINIISNSDGINFISAHSAKGLEFKHVFIINATKKTWGEKTTNNPKFPDSLTSSAGVASDEDERRLFYVAVTRAMEHCYIMFPFFQSENKESGNLKFLHEMGYDLENIQEEKINEEKATEYLATIQQHENKVPVMIDKEIIDQIMETLAINATGVNKYLSCQIKFYFENILRVPGARKAAPGYGNALHYALDQFSRELERNPGREVPPLSALIFHFEKGMKKFKSHFTLSEFDSHLYEGKQTLTHFYNNSKHTWTMPVANKTEYHIQGNVDNVPISGIIDRIAIYDNHVEVYDYKTGKYNSAKQTAGVDENKYGGDYWRQAVFYKILLDQDINYRGKMRTANVVYLQKDDDDLIKEIKINDSSIEFVKEQITSVYNGIKNYEFSKGCGKCSWCAFVNETMGIDKVVEEIED